jgi:hypothetical protein
VGCQLLGYKEKGGGGSAFRNAFFSLFLIKILSYKIYVIGSGSVFKTAVWYLHPLSATISAAGAATTITLP